MAFSVWVSPESLWLLVTTSTSPIQPCVIPEKNSISQMLEGYLPAKLKDVLLYHVFHPVYKGEIP